jgi:hypothetical protein
MFFSHTFNQCRKVDGASASDSTGQFLDSRQYSLAIHLNRCERGAHPITPWTNDFTRRRNMNGF